MERAKQLVGPVLAVVLITAVALVPRWLSHGRTAGRVGERNALRGVPTERRYEPITYRFLYPHECGVVAGRLTFARIVDGRVARDAAWSFDSLAEWCDWAPGFFAQEQDWTPRFQPGWFISRCLDTDELAGCTNGQLFWWIQALRFLDPESFANEIEWIEVSGKTLRLHTTLEQSHYDYDSDTLYWNPVATEYTREDPNLCWKWFKTTPLVTLAYGLSHARYDLCCDGDRSDPPSRERAALATENRIRHILYRKDPACSHIHPRPGFRETWPDLAGQSPEEAWRTYAGRVEH
ncbi:MAG TPA: hypothetical protein PKH24_19280 [Sedimentisphaerales bacterium]|jgi:hypothetical protein|nr:hypothetical protein [Sedimentisphaerales bacterium]HNU31210.1 hypothetical protein [Sedimentisphaerales bacterium]